MQTQLERAVAGEVLAEIKRQRYTYKEIQAASGVKARAFSYYFTAGERSIPLYVLDAVCAVLKVPTAEMIARGAARVTDQGDDELEAGLSAADRAVVEKGRAEHGVPPKDGPARGRRHSA